MPAATTAGGRAPLLRAEGVSKRFGGVRALADARMVVSGPGVVHCLAGENGSGKSTLLGVLSGQLRPDVGTVEIDGNLADIHRPSDALAYGIAMVAQETALAPDLSVAENVLLGGRLVRGPAGIRWRATRSRAQELLEPLGVRCDPRTPVRDLRPDQRQMVEIARALSMDAKLLVLDEPTSSLTDDQTAGLFSVIRDLRSGGVSVVFVSHRLTELFEICDEVTVLRDGRTVAEGPIGAFDAHSLVEAMVGEATAATAAAPAARRAGPREAGAAPVLEVRGLSTAGRLDDLDLEVRAGEVVGVAGLVGSGRSELLGALFGLAPTTGATEIRLAGEPHAPRSPRHSIVKGVGYLPPDRKTQALLLGMSVRENLAIVSTSGRNRLTAPTLRDETRAFSEASKTMRIRANSDRAPAGTLSGGNQQKVALGKWLADAPRLLLLDEPTRGVDVAAKAEIHELLRGVADRGVAMLVSSSEYDELLTLCDRIIVMFRGRMVATLPSSEASEQRLAALAGGHR
jgi:ABC-type sugar transport system ATPase subunit